MATTEIPTRSQMIRKLEKNEVQVKFRKSDKTTRTMRCTLRSDTVPYYDGKAGGENKEVINVYDLEKFQWRSFRVDAVKDFKVLDWREKSLDHTEARLFRATGDNGLYLPWLDFSKRRINANKLE